MRYALAWASPRFAIAFFGWEIFLATEHPAGEMQKQGRDSKFAELKVFGQVQFLNELNDWFLFVLGIHEDECRERLLSKGGNLLLGKRGNFDIRKAPEFKRFCGCSAGGNKQVV